MLRGIAAGMLLGVATTLYMSRPRPVVRTRRAGRLLARVRRTPVTRGAAAATAGLARAMDVGRAGLAQLRQLVR
ncbi:hypothetical protein LIP_2620 [Limnochorda pilosa]|uniref:Uncharacterized protein n=2 Tax=Limnochorda pilosa TaxID=1555112 RepID=A0A0K2SMV8_LIMPI|nr:hypothetical protein LIP_2620 [Limnochorda pilosa]